MRAIYASISIEHFRLVGWYVMEAMEELNILQYELL